MTADSGATVRPARILIVDDEPAVSEVLSEFLSGIGFDVKVAADATAAEAAIAEYRPDVILTDINLPGRSGLDVMRVAREHDPEIAVIVITGYASAGTAIEALRQGALDYITKPFDLDQVQKLVERGSSHRRLRAENRRLLEELKQKNAILLRHEHELEQRVRIATSQLKNLYEVGKEISANLELSPRLQIACHRTRELMGARAAALLLRHPETDQFRISAASGFPADETADRTFAPGGLLERVSRQGRPERRVSEKGVQTLPDLPGLEWQSIVAVPLVAEGEGIGVLVASDGTDGFSAEDEEFLVLFASQTAIAVRNSQLFERTKSLDRLKSDFVAVVSHEIRTPLTSIKGAVELLGDPRFFQNNDQQAKLITIAHANTERLLVLISDILDFSKIESASLRLQRQVHAVEPIVATATENLKTLLCERHIDLRVHLAPELPEVYVDPDRISQVLTNLLSNAIKFSPEAGRIEVSAVEDGDTVRIGVSDHGEGIAPGNMSKLFQKFSQIDPSATRKAGGTGLGLAISKGIVEQHGGSIWVESTPGQGSTFYFTMPAGDGVLRDAVA